MYKLNPSEKWYEKAAEEEDKFLDQSIGGIIFNFDQLSISSEVSSIKSYSKLIKKSWKCRGRY